VEMIPDNLWNEIKNAIPKKKHSIGRPNSDARRVLSGVFFVMETGVQWRNLPRCYGPPSTVHGRFMKWVRCGVFDKIMQIARTKYQNQPEQYKFWYAIDTSHTKAPLANYGGRNPTDRGRHGVKKVLITDRIGAPLAATVAPSNVHDSKLLKPALRALGLRATNPSLLLTADSAFDARELRKFCIERGIILIATKNTRRGKSIDRSRPKGREIIEQTFGHFAWYRGLKICWNKTAESFLAYLQFAASLRLFRLIGVFG